VSNFDGCSFEKVPRDVIKDFLFHSVMMKINPLTLAIVCKLFYEMMTDQEYWKYRFPKRVFKPKMLLMQLKWFGFDYTTRFYPSFEQLKVLFSSKKDEISYDVTGVVQVTRQGDCIQFFTSIREGVNCQLVLNRDDKTSKLRKHKYLLNITKLKNAISILLQCDIHRFKFSTNGLNLVGMGDSLSYSTTIPSNNELSSYVISDPTKFSLDGNLARYDITFESLKVIRTYAQNLDRNCIIDVKCKIRKGRFHVGLLKIPTNRTPEEAQTKVSIANLRLITRFACLNAEVTSSPRIRICFMEKILCIEVIGQDFVFTGFCQ
jgi:hypothetical protein